MQKINIGSQYHIPMMHRCKQKNADNFCISLLTKSALAFLTCSCGTLRDLLPNIDIPGTPVEKRWSRFILIDSQHAPRFFTRFFISYADLFTEYLKQMYIASSMYHRLVPF